MPHRRYCRENRHPKPSEKSFILKLLSLLCLEILSKSIQMAHELFIVNSVVEITLKNFEEGTSSKKAVASCLVLLTYALDLELVCNLLKTSSEILAALHEKFNVVHAGEVNPKQIEELCLFLWKRFARQ